MTFNPNIDAKSRKIEAPIMLGGSPEFLATDGQGKIYINLEDKDVVAVVDLKTRKVIARWPLAPGGSPVGMSMDAGKHRLFIGCRKPQKLIVMSTQSGKVEAPLPIGAGVDATAARTRDRHLLAVGMDPWLSPARNQARWTLLAVSNMH